MGSYVFFVGGSGSKMLEATLHAAAAGVLRHPGAAIRAVIVDLDQTGGNLKRAESLTAPRRRRTSAFPRTLPSTA